MASPTSTMRARTCYKQYAGTVAGETGPEIQKMKMQDGHGSHPGGSGPQRFSSYRFVGKTVQAAREIQPP